jgi:hypothetical protein
LKLPTPLGLMDRKYRWLVWSRRDAGPPETEGAAEPSADDTRNGGAPTPPAAPGLVDAPHGTGGGWNGRHGPSTARAREISGMPGVDQTNGASIRSRRRKSNLSVAF